MDCSLPGSSVHGILQARVLECVSMPSFQGIFLIQGSNPHLLSLLHWQAGCLPLTPPWKSLCVCVCVCIYLFMGKRPVQFLGWQHPVEKGQATPSSILAWRIPWTIQSMGHKDQDMTKGLSFSLSIITLKVREGNNLLARILSLIMDHEILIISTIFTVPFGMLFCTTKIYPLIFYILLQGLFYF